MSCVRFGEGVIVCGGGEPLYRRLYMDCPTCKRRRRFVCCYGGAWYADDVTCCGCGDSWSGGEMRERPFKRGWRKEAIFKAQNAWYNLAVPPREYWFSVRADLDYQLADAS